MKTWFSVKNLATAHGGGPPAAEVSIYDEIGAYGVTAADYLSTFNALPDGDVTVNLNSPGGDVFQALAIMNGMRATGRDVTVRVMGVAASAASLIAMAGTRIEMPANTFMMLHSPMTGTYGNAGEMREAADMLDTIGASLQATYVQRSGQSPEVMAGILSKDSWLTAQECLDLGLCDEVTPAVDITAKWDADRKGLPSEVVAALKLSMPALRAPAAQAATATPVGEPIPFADRIQARAKAAGLSEYAATFALDPGISSDESLATAIAQAREIVALCAIVNAPDAAKAAIHARKTAADVRAELIAVRAAQDRAHAVSSIPAIGANARPHAAEFSVTDFWRDQTTQARARGRQASNASR